MRRASTVVVAAAVLVMTLVSPVAADSEAHTHYGESARKVAREIHCRHFDGNGGGRFNLDSGVCRLKGKRVNVITFSRKRQQRKWNSLAEIGLPSGHWWGNGKGALVTARNGNRPAAKIGAHRLPGVLKKSY